MNKYLTKRYLSDDRLMAFVEQYKYINSNDKVLEIGKGTGVFGDIASKIAEYKVIDIDPNTNPDYIGNILNIEDLIEHIDKFDIVFCCQVLEHLPFEHFKNALTNIMKLNSKKIVISLPDNRSSIKLNFQILRFVFEKVLSIPFSGKLITKNNHPEHYWEIWYKNSSEIREIFGFDGAYKLVSDYRLFERPYQHFFILEKAYQ